MVPGEVTVAGDLRTINTACVTYAATHPDLGFPLMLSELGPEGEGLIGASLARGVVRGYAFVYVAADIDGDGIRDAYQVSAIPLERGNTRYLFTDQSGIIRYSKDYPATAESPPLL